MSTTTNLALNEPAYNSTSPTWDQPLNYNSTILDQMFGNTTSVSVNTGGSTTYTNIAAPSATAAGSTSQCMRLNLTGALSANQNVLLPQNVAGMWVFTNSTSGAYTVTIGSNNGSNVAAGTTVSAPQGYSVILYCDGTNVKKADDGLIQSVLSVANGGTGSSTLTANNVILGNGTSPVQFVAPGTSGNVLQSNGTTWASVALTNTVSGTLLRAPQVIANTAGGTYTTPANCNHILIEMIGGGGAGGGVPGSTGSSTQGGGGGGSLFAVKYASVSPSTGYTYTVGAGGTGSGNGNGTAGGTTSIVISGTTYSVSGGTGGTASSSGTGASGSTGTATNMDYSINPIDQVSGYNGGSVTTPYGQNVGGNRIVGIGQIGGGNPGYGFGAGGGGAQNNSYTGAGNQSGGNGFQGVIRIWEYT
jgi:hypothetical protein